MKNLSFRACALPLAVLAAAMAPLLVNAQGVYQYRVHKPSLAVSAATSPAMQLSTSAIDFGNVATHTLQTRQVLVSNTGTGALLFTAAPAVAGSAAFTAGVTTCGASVAAGASCLAEANFSPTQEGSFNGTLTFTSALASSPHEVTLVGTAFNPVSLAPTSRLELPQAQPFSFDFKSLLAVTNEETPDKLKATWSAAGSLPAGLSLDPTTGVLSGTPLGGPAAGEDFAVNVQYKGNSASRTFSAITNDSHWTKVHTLIKFDNSLTNAKTGAAWTAHNGATFSGTAKFGTAALDTSGAGRAVSGPAFRPASSFTVEGWIRPTSLSGTTIINLGGIANLNWQPQAVYLGWPSPGQLNWLASSANNGTDISNSNGCTMPCNGYTTFGAPTLNAWNHFAVVRDAPAGRYYLYLNGTRRATVVSSVGPHRLGSAYAVTIGNYPTNSQTNFLNAGFPGLIDEVRLTDGVARYTADTYVVPTFEFPAR